MDHLPSTVVYTCITGAYDELQPPSFVDERLSYVAFVTDPSATSDVWDVRVIPVDDELGVVKTARRVKILAHEVLSEFDRSVWIDGNIDVIGDVTSAFDAQPDAPLIAFAHPKRSCVYEEGLAVVRLGKEPREVVERQLARYRSEGYPERNGLIESNVLLRRHDDADVRRLMTCWWDTLRAGSRRDQLSFNYCAWRSGVPYATMGSHHTRGASPIFRMRGGHSRRRSLRERVRRIVAKLRYPGL